jgi:HAD superfamily hydrolase (TIGR01509 family)
VITAVVFDLDGVIVDSEQVWDEVREAYTEEKGGHYRPTAARDMQGMSSLEWSRYMAEKLGVPGTPVEINAAVVKRMLERYGEDPPLIPGAADVVREVGQRWPVAIASSSNPELIEVVIKSAGLRAAVRTWVSSEEVPRGKPAPDVYLEAARRLGIDAVDCAAVEDSQNGIRSAKAAQMRVFAIPNPHYPPDEASLAEADFVLESIRDLPVALSAFRP